MALIKYIGRSDARILDARDLQSLGVEGFKKTTFHRRQPVEVDDNVAKALTSTKALGREFSIVSEDDELEEVEEADSPSVLTQKESAENVAGSGQSSGTGGSARTASTASATGTGGSTGGSRRSGRGSSTSGAS